MFCPRDLPSFSEIRELTQNLLGVDATAIFTAMRTLEVADALAGAVEFNLRHQFGLSVGRFSLLMILHRYSESELTPSDLAERAGHREGAAFADERSLAAAPRPVPSAGASAKPRVRLLPQLAASGRRSDSKRSK